jgi:psp operon transcriptional activator
MYFASRMSAELGMGGVPEISERALEKLENHVWPGNVRELKNIVERAVYQSGGSVINDVDFDPLRSPWENADSAIATNDDRLFTGLENTLRNQGLEAAREELEKRALADALTNCRTQSEAARRLGMNYNQFRALYRKHRP